MNGMVTCDVTFDGLWHKRGHRLNFGVGAVVEVITSLILDYEVCSKVCFICSKKQKTMENEKITPTEYVMWLEDDCNDCNKNYKGPAGGMEAFVAKLMWGRFQQYKLIYKTFVSNGDSSAYLAVTSVNGNKGLYGQLREFQRLSV